MARIGELGEFEELLLLAVQAENGEAYGNSLLELLEQGAGRKASLGAIQITLERLEKKAFVESRWGDPLPERGGRRRRYYSITAQGATALEQAERTRERIRTGRRGWFRQSGEAA